MATEQSSEIWVAVISSQEVVKTDSVVASQPDACFVMVLGQWVRVVLAPVMTWHSSLTTLTVVVLHPVLLVVLVLPGLIVHPERTFVAVEVHVWEDLPAGAVAIVQ